uniref:Uncharacterized protein n=1 Tax=Proboscia inermis TaxID=420281 RepID=A0A7S0GCR0_9STRA
MLLFKHMVCKLRVSMDLRCKQRVRETCYKSGSPSRNSRSSSCGFLIPSFMPTLLPFKARISENILLALIPLLLELVAELDSPVSNPPIPTKSASISMSLRDVYIEGSSCAVDSKSEESSSIFFCEN